jgi:hypothetical protein
MFWISEFLFFLYFFICFLRALCIWNGLGGRFGHRFWHGTLRLLGPDLLAQGYGLALDSDTALGGLCASSHCFYWTGIYDHVTMESESLWMLESGIRPD